MLRARTLILGLALLAASPDARGGGELLRWRLGPEAGIVYKVGGPDPKAVCDGALDERTLYGAELTGDGVGLETPVGRPLDLAYHYLFALPRAAVDQGSVVAVDDVHELLPFTVGPIAAKGETRVVRRSGPTFQLETRLKLSRGANAIKENRFAEGTLTVTQVFNAKKGTLVSGEVDLAWTDKDLSPPKEVHASRKATFTAGPAIDLGAATIRSRAEQAVKRGLDKDLRPFLERAAYRPKGPDHALGHLGLALYAAVKAGMDPAQPPLTAAFEDIDKLPWKNTYSVSLALLALESRSVKRVKRPGESRARFEKEGVEKRDLDRMERLARWLLEAHDPRGYWYYGPKTDPRPKDHDFGDLSTTQFAVLALHAAARSGVKLGPEVWRQVAETCLADQEGGGPQVPLDLRLEPGASPLRRPEGAAAAGPTPGGDAGGTASRGERPQATQPRTRAARGFTYYPPGLWRYPWGSMSAAGVSSLLCAKQWLLREKEPDKDLLRRVDDGIDDGLAWLGARFSMRQNWPDRDFWPYYAVYSYEKAYELGRIERIDGHDWWSEGAEELLLREKPGGGWGGEPAETAFAILFLTRATTEPDFDVREAGQQVSGGAAAKPGDEDAVTIEGLGLVSAREVIRATEVREAEKRRGRIELAEKAIAGLDEERRPVVAPALGRLLGSSYPECKKLGERALRDVAGAAVEDERAAEAFLERWEAVTKAGRSGDFDRIPELVERLQRDPLPAVRRAAALALSRLRALEAVPDLIAELERADADKAYRGYIRQILVGTLGRDPGDDVASWRALWKASGPAELAREAIRRDVRRLSRPAEAAAARERLAKAGKAAVRPLIDALPDPASPQPAPGAPVGNDGRAAAEALRDITGQDFGQDRARWETWWREEGQRK